MRKRETWVKNEETAGCYLCNGTLPKWQGKGAQGKAAKHHDATGHTTWCLRRMQIDYGDISQRADVLAYEAKQRG